MQQLTCKMVWHFSFYSLKKGLILRESPGGKSVEKCGKVWRSVEKCEKVPTRFCPLVVALSFFSDHCSLSVEPEFTVTIPLTPQSCKEITVHISQIVRPDM